jgi:predicted peptidase
MKTYLAPAALAIVTMLSTQALAFAPPSDHPPAEPLTAGKQVVQTIEQGGNSWLYLICLPPGYDAEPQRQWPCIIYFGVMGATYESYVGFDGLFGYGLSKYLQDPSTCTYVSDSFVVVTPWLTSDLNPCWTNPENIPTYNAFFPPLFDHLQSTVRIDPNRIHTTGYCFGGAVSYKYVALYPEFPASMLVWTVNDNWASCVNVSKACQFKDIPMQFFHNATDDLIPWESCKLVADAIIDCGNTQVIWNLSPTGRHESWENDRDKDPALYEWMLAQVKSSSTAAAPARGRITGSTSFLGSAVSADDRIEVVALNGQIRRSARGSGTTVSQMLPDLLTFNI